MKVSSEMLSLHQPRLSKEDLVPKKGMHHSNPGIDQLLFTVFDDYAQEYGEFFQEAVTEFDEKLDTLKREIYYNNMTDKNTQSGTQANVTMMTDRDGCPSQIDAVTKTDNGAIQIDSQLEDKIFPSLAALRSMGVYDFKPSFKHKIEYANKIANIYNDPKLEVVSPRIHSNLHNGNPTSIDLSIKLQPKKLQKSKKKGLIR